LEATTLNQHTWRIGEVQGGFRWGKLDGKKPLGKYRCSWEDNIKMYPQKAGWKGTDCTDRTKDKNAVMNAKFP
jgi:hypothetical protein